MKKRYEVLAAIREDPRASYQELMERTHLHTVSAIAYHVERLIAEGLLRREPRLARSLEVVANPLPASPNCGRAPKLGEVKVDQRKRNSAKTCEKKQKAGQQGRGTSATIYKQNTERRLNLNKRIEMVVRMATQEESEHVKDVVKDHKGYGSLHAVRVG